MLYLYYMLDLIVGHIKHLHYILSLDTVIGILGGLLHSTSLGLTSVSIHTVLGEDNTCTNSGGQSGAWG